MARQQPTYKLQQLSSSSSFLVQLHCLLTLQQGAIELTVAVVLLRARLLVMAVV